MENVVAIQNVQQVLILLNATEEKLNVLQEDVYQILLLMFYQNVEMI